MQPFTVKVAKAPASSRPIHVKSTNAHAGVTLTPPHPTESPQRRRDEMILKACDN